MQYQPPLDPPNGTLRVIKTFLWLPRKIDYSYVPLDSEYRGRILNGYDWRWLEQTYILQRFGEGLAYLENKPKWYDLVFFLPSTIPRTHNPRAYDPFIQLSAQGQTYLSNRPELTKFISSILP